MFSFAGSLLFTYSRPTPPSPLPPHPLTSAAQVQLQSGHFDVADRLFHHMGELWKGSTQSMGDVKELIPEFYYLDDMFSNSSCLPLGTRQNGETVSDVVR